MVPFKYTYQQVFDDFASENCTLISKNYKTVEDKLEYTYNADPDHKIYTITYAH